MVFLDPPCGHEETKTVAEYVAKVVGGDETENENSSIEQELL